MDHTYPTINRDLLATCWTWAGDVLPLAGGGDEISPVDLLTRVRAVRDAGWRGVGFILADLLPIHAAGRLGELRTMLDDHGIDIVELEFLGDWWETGQRRAASDEARRLLFESAAALGARTIKVSGDWDTPGVADDVFVSALHALGADAAEHGTRVAVEPMPMNNIRTLQAGARLVREADHPAAGLCVDTQHVRRGGTAYRDMASFLDIDKVFVVELDDSLLDLGGRTPLDDGINHRLYPGHGELEVAEFVAAMAALGWNGPWGVEIISTAHRALPLAEGVRLVHEATMAVMDEAEELLRQRATPVA